MRTEYDGQLRALNRELQRMGSLCEKVIDCAATALLTGNIALAAQIAPVDGEIDQLERDIESLCLKLLLKQQPVAGDLRQISAALKMITDMERIGDQAEDIGEIISVMDGHSWDCTPIDEMARAASKMVTDSVEAYICRDTAMAEAVIARDDVVDACFDRVKSALIGRIAEKPQEGEYALDLLMIAKYFERIGDHATNIAEWAVFSVTGVHKSDEL